MPTIIRSPTGDGDNTATTTIFPASPTTRFDKVDEYPTADDNTTYLTLTANGRWLFTFGAISVPSYATNIRLFVSYKHRKAASQSCNIRSALKVGGSYYDTTDGGINPTNGTWNDRQYEYATNPKTGLAWTADDVNGAGSNGLQQFGLYSSDASPAPYVTQVFLTITYDQNVNAQAGSWNAEIASGGAPKKSVALQAIAVAAAIGFASPTIVSAGGVSVYATAGAANEQAAGALSGRSRAADASGWNAEFAAALSKRARDAIAAAQSAGIAGGDPSRTRAGQAAGSNAEAAGAEGSRTRFADAAGSNEQVAGAEGGRSRLAEAGATNREFAAGLGTIEAAGVVFATASGWNAGIAGADGARDRSADAGAMNAGIGAADPSRIREASAAGFDSAIAGALGKRTISGSASGSNAGIAGAWASMKKIVFAAAGGFNRAIGGALAILTQYLPGAIERDVQPRIREADVDYSERFSASVDPRIREAQVNYTGDIMASRKPHIETIFKTKNEEFNISFVWKTPDIDAGATISNCVVSVLPAGLTLQGAVVIDAANNKTSQLIKAGIVGGTYRVSMFITTSAGQKFEAFWDVHII